MNVLPSNSEIIARAQIAIFLALQDKLKHVTFSKDLPSLTNKECIILSKDFNVKYKEIRTAYPKVF